MRKSVDNQKSGCVHFPNRKTCRWCQFSCYPELFDGGCMIGPNEHPGDPAVEQRYWELYRQRREQKSIF